MDSIGKVSYSFLLLCVYCQLVCQFIISSVTLVLLWRDPFRLWSAVKLATFNLPLKLNWPACLRHTQCWGMSSLRLLTATPQFITPLLYHKEHVSLMCPFIQRIISFLWQMTRSCLGYHIKRFFPTRGRLVFQLWLWLTVVFPHSIADCCWNAPPWLWLADQLYLLSHIFIKQIWL